MATGWSDISVWQEQAQRLFPSGLLACDKVGECFVGEGPGGHQLILSDALPLCGLHVHFACGGGARRQAESSCM